MEIAVLAPFSQREELVARYTRLWIGMLVFILPACSCSLAQDPGWPRQLVKPGGKLIVSQPQVDDWNNFTDIKWRQAFQLTPTGGKRSWERHRSKAPLK